MTRDQFIAAGNYLYGRHWQQRMAEVLRTQPSTVSRWANASTEVSGPASVAVQLLVAAKQAGLSLPLAA